MRISFLGMKPSARRPVVCHMKAEDAPHCKADLGRFAEILEVPDERA